MQSIIKSVKSLLKPPFMWAKKTYETIKDYLLFNGSLIFIRKEKKATGNSILLLPPADLNGSFGDDLMVYGYLENFTGGRPVTIYAQQKIIRDDLLKGFTNITYLGGLNHQSYYKKLKLIKRSSEVYSIGADIMDGIYGPEEPMTRIKILHIANRVGIKTEFSGFSTSNKTLPEIKKALAKLSSGTYIKARDIDSYNRMKEYIPEDRLILTSDIAFLCPDIPAFYKGPEYDRYVNWCVAMRQQSKKIIGFCSNSIQANNMGLEKYMASTTRMLDKFLESDNYAIAFFYHDIRPLCGSDTDETISKKLHEHFSAQKVDTFFPEGLVNGLQIKGYISQIDFTLSGRMHFCISGLTYHKPMFGVGYANKFEGMIKLFGIDPALCIVEYNDMEKADAIIREFSKHLGEMKEKISKSLHEVKKTSLKNLQGEVSA